MNLYRCGQGFLSLLVVDWSWAQPLQEVEVRLRRVLGRILLSEAGFRMYLSIWGQNRRLWDWAGIRYCLIIIPVLLLSYVALQGRSLVAGDQLALGECEPLDGEEVLQLPASLLPTYPSAWTIHTLSGPHDDPEFITREGIEAFYATQWTISASSNRMGIRLEAGSREPVHGIAWARSNGGEGGSHPSNIHDNGYALGSVNLNGDTPVLLTNEGPSMGGYLCVTTVASGDL